MTRLVALKIIIQKKELKLRFLARTKHKGASLGLKQPSVTKFIPRYFHCTRAQRAPKSVRNLSSSSEQALVSVESSCSLALSAPFASTLLFIAIVTSSLKRDPQDLRVSLLYNLCQRAHIIPILLATSRASWSLDRIT